MKKILDKIVSIALAVVGLLFITLLLVVMFGAVGVDELNNQLVRVLVISLSAVFAVLAGVIIVSAFTDHDKLNSILLFKDKESATKAAVTVVKSLVRKASKRVEAAKVTKVVLMGDENNNVRLVVYIKVKSNDTEAVINRVRAEIMATCYKVLEYQFSSVDFRITQVKADYKPTDKEIDEKVAVFQKEKEAAKLKEAAKAKAVEEAAMVVVEAEKTEGAEVIAAVVEAEVYPISESAEAEEAKQDEEADIAVAAPDTEVLAAADLQEANNLGEELDEADISADESEESKQD